MKQIPFEQTIKLLERCEIPVVPSSVFKDREEAWSFVSQMDKPAAMKIDAADIWHRTEAKGVFLNISQREDFDRAWRDLIKIEGARGIIVQEMRSGTELALGVKRDAQFGPVLMFGLGGILVELMKDVSFRVAPIDLIQARQMISEIKGYRLLTGFRDRPVVDQDQLAEMLVNLGCLAAEHPEIEEIDLNPVMADGKIIEAVDAKIWVLDHEG